MIEDNFIGIDISKNKFDACLLKANSSLHKVFSNNLKGFDEFYDWLQEEALSPWAIMEATGHYSEPLANFLCQKSVRVSIVNPLQIKHFAKAKLARNKNDKVDAGLIGHYGKMMKPTLYQQKPAAQKETRERIQLIDTLQEQRVRLKNQEESVGTPSVKKDLQKAIGVLDKQIEKLKDKLEQQMQSDEKWSATVNLLTTIKGIGNISAYKLLAYLPDLSQFQTAKQLAAFIGVSPQQRQSGKYVGKTCLSKKGNARLRSVLYMPALSAKRYNDHLKPWIMGLEKKGLAPKAIVGAVMRKLVHIIFGILKNNKPFDPQLV
jgi:transposase